MGLSEVLTSVRNTLRTVEGVKYAPEKTPAQINDWPAAIVFSSSGTFSVDTFENEAGNIGTIGTHTIRILLIKPLKDYDEDVEFFNPFSERVHDALLAKYAEDKFDGSVFGISNIRSKSDGWLSYELVQNEWATTTIGLRFSFVITIQRDVVQ